MKPDASELLVPAAADTLVQRGRSDIAAWAQIGLLVALLGWILGWYWPTAASIEATWARSETFAHGYLIAPISLWLVWRRRADLAGVPLVPSAAHPLALLAALGLGWLAADTAQVAVARQYCLVLMLVTAVWIVLGTRLARTMAFPLAFLLFAVPFGEFLIPPLIGFTADFTVGALRLTGIPVFREGNHFTLPSGNWSVVEACSGLRYLIASATLGSLYAYLTYRRLLYRLVFVALSIVVPILANGIRAYLIVMLGHLSGMKLAVGVDHLIYGWVFFGLVMLLLFWAGSFWREAEAPMPSTQPAAGIADAAGPVGFLTRGIAVVLAGAAIAAIWPAYAGRLHTWEGGAVNLPAPQVPGWIASAEPITTWMPNFPNTSVRLDRVYTSQSGAVGLFLGYYRAQGEETKLVSSTNGVESNARPQWVRVGGGERPIVSGGSVVAVSEAQLRGPGKRLLAWHWYWVGGTSTTRPVVAKLLQARHQLLGQGDDGAVVILYAPYDERPEGAAALLAEFASASLPAIERSLQHASKR